MSLVPLLLAGAVTIEIYVLDGLALCTMTAALLFQPVLMGRPRQVEIGRPEQDPNLRQAAE